MELTSQAINEAEFSMARRGYDPDQVDEFLEKLAVAVDKQSVALEEARAQLAEAERKVVEAERQIAERPERVVDAGVGPEVGAEAARQTQLTASAEVELETLQRTLLLAQKTADATVRDAEEEARQMIAKAEADASAAEEVTRARLLAEIGKLDADRSALEADLLALNSHLDEQRSHLRGTITDLEALLDDPARLKEAPVPELSEVVTAGVPGEDAAGELPVGGDLPIDIATADAADTPTEDPGDGGDEESSSAAAPLVTADELGRHGRVESDQSDQSGLADDAAVLPPPPPPPPPAPTASGPEEDDDAWARFGTEDAVDDDDGGPPTQPVLRLDDLEQDRMPQPGDTEDAYLSELRKAMLEDRGAPDVDESYGDNATRQRFGRRR